MSDFPEGVAAPDGAQKLVDVCKGTWAVISDKNSEAAAGYVAIQNISVCMTNVFIAFFIFCNFNFNLFREYSSEKKNIKFPTELMGFSSVM